MTFPQGLYSAFPIDDCLLIVVQFESYQWYHRCLTQHVWPALSNRTISADLQMSSPSFKAGMLDRFRTVVQRQVKQDLPNLLSTMALVFTKPGHLLG